MGRLSEIDALGVEVSDLREKLSDALAGGMQHQSDCAVYSAPAATPEPCTCGTGSLADKYRQLLDGVLTQFDHQGCSCTFSSDDCCAYAKAKAFLSQPNLKTFFARAVA